MNRHQRIALQHHCRLASETAHPRFARLIRGGAFSVVLTINSGYE
jgi:hypothetical protein